MHLWGGGCLCIERKGGVGNRCLAILDEILPPSGGVLSSMDPYSILLATGPRILHAIP